MNHFIHIIKDIGIHMNGFASFISDIKALLQVHTRFYL